MSKGFRQSQAFLHTWSGLLLGWMLFLVVVTGTIAFWREGLDRWSRPELARIEQPMRVMAGAQAFLTEKAPDAKSWFIQVADETAPGAQFFWVPQPKPGEPRGRGGRRGRRDTQALIGAHGQVAHARETRGGEFFYRFHFDPALHAGHLARWLGGIAAIADSERHRHAQEASRTSSPCVAPRSSDPGSTGIMRPPCWRCRST